MLFIKKKIVFVLIFFAFISCSEKREKGIVLINNILYETDSVTVYNGLVSDTISGKRIEYYVTDGLKNGIMNIYHTNGKLEVSGYIKNNLNEGLWKYFYPSGKLESEGYFLNDKPDGEWKWYYPSGVLRETGSFTNGNRKGIWKLYSEDGKIIEEKKF